MAGSKTKFTVRHRFSFESAHQLPGHPTCGAVHGHSYRGEIKVTAARLSGQGYVVEFGALKDIARRYDHARILTQTAEQLAEEIGRAVLTHIREQSDRAEVTKVLVVLWETPDGCAEWSWRSA